jgi:hypothetical protein
MEMEMEMERETDLRVGPSRSGRGHRSVGGHDVRVTGLANGPGTLIARSDRYGKRVHEEYSDSIHQFCGRERSGIIRYGGRAAIRWRRVGVDGTEWMGRMNRGVEWAGGWRADCWMGVEMWAGLSWTLPAELP